MGKTRYKKIVTSCHFCSIRKLFRPYFLRYESHIQGRFSNRKELVQFLTMVKLKERKLQWALRQTGTKNKELAYHLEIGIRRWQQIKAYYRRTGEVPKLVKTRRPPTTLQEEDKLLIDKACKESNLRGAVALRLYIAKYYQRRLPYGKIHRYLLSIGISQEDEKKKKQRIYHLYERDHSFSLAHLDWHVAKCIPDKQVCVVEDDASRLILCGGEYDQALEEHNISLMKQAIRKAYNDYSAAIRQVNTDKGSQFYANTKTADGDKGTCAFEEFLEQQSIQHIPSRRNHPQTNGKNERWFRTYEENRMKFATFDAFMRWYNNRIHLGLSRKEGITPHEAVLNKLQPESLIGLFFRRFE